MSSLREFIRIATDEGLGAAIYQTIKYLQYTSGLRFDFQNSVQFKDFRLGASCDIGQKLPRSTKLPHPMGIVIGGNVQFGENIRVYQNVTIGTGFDSVKYPTIEDSVTIYSGAAVIGDITVGEGAVIGANSVVIDDVPPDSTVVGAPGTVVNSGEKRSET